MEDVAKLADRAESTVAAVYDRRYLVPRETGAHTRCEWIGNAEKCGRIFPSSQRRGGRAINKMDPFRNRRGRGGQFGEPIQAWTFRRTDHPVCGFFGGFATFIDAAAFPSSARRGIP